jgi:hypothetical protein
MNSALWIIQGLLAALFIFAGGMKLVVPMEEMARQMGFSVGFLHFIGVAELLGGIGLVLPGLINLRAVLTPLAAVCLTIIMIGATVVTLNGNGAAAALFPLLVGVLCAFIAYARSWLLPHGSAGARNAGGGLGQVASR